MKFFILFSFIFLIFSSFDAQPSQKTNKKKADSLSYSKKQKHILLLGASIGREWNIPDLPHRINNFDYKFEYIHGGGWDKSKSLREILSRSQNKPDAVFLKECAAYFPANLDVYRNLMKKWVQECFKEDVIPIPATVVPVTRLHSIKKFLIDIIKIRNPFKQGFPFSHKRNKSILEFNDWVRTYCRKHGLGVLDLEAAVRYSSENRYLREDFARIDGLHLNSKAYELLDQIVVPTLEKVNWEVKNAGTNN